MKNPPLYHIARTDLKASRPRRICQRLGQLASPMTTDPSSTGTGQILLGSELNLMSLGGLALGVGMLVDNSIVVLENIFRHREEEGEDAALAGWAHVVQGPGRGAHAPRLPPPARAGTAAARAHPGSGHPGPGGHRLRGPAFAHRVRASIVEGLARVRATRARAVRQARKRATQARAVPAAGGLAAAAKKNGDRHPRRRRAHRRPRPGGGRR